jgi:hypothetical protein
MNAKRLLVVLIALSLMFGASCFAALWMDAVGRVSGWTGLPQYESKIPEVRWYGTLWESLAVGFLFIAAFLLGLGKRVTANEVSPTWFAVLLGFLGRLGISIIGAVVFVLLLGIIPRLHRS